MMTIWPVTLLKPTLPGKESKFKLLMYIPPCLIGPHGSWWKDQVLKYNSLTYAPSIILILMVGQ